jgi:hypothetical protein
MALILLGALLFLGGVLFIALQPLKGRLSRARRVGPGRGGTTLEPERPARGFDMKSNWPGLALIAAGTLLMLIASF